MSTNAFPQLERDYNEAEARRDEARARLAEWYRRVNQPDTAESVQESAIAENNSMQVSYR